MKNKKIAILAFWSVDRVGDEFFCPYIHWLYLKYITQIYKEVILVSPVRVLYNIPPDKTQIMFDNLIIYEMPYIKNYLAAQKYYSEYKRAIKSLDLVVDLFYSRVPDPFSWLPNRMTSKPCIMHFVGDIIEATKRNENWSWLKKKVMIMGYYPEGRRVLNACLSSVVYANGNHIAASLLKKNIYAIPVISSTISPENLPDQLINIQTNPIRLIYVGYLRPAKGVNTIKKVIEELVMLDIDFTFDIIGDGEMYSDLKTFILNNGLLDKVILHGHINDHSNVLSLLRQSDLFFFPSLSEGSPRVVIEAMSQGLAVLSTPVGSLPSAFKENSEILFFPFEDVSCAINKINFVIKNTSKIEKMRINAFNKIRNHYTIEKFINKVFTIS